MPEKAQVSHSSENTTINEIAVTRGSFRYHDGFGRFQQRKFASEAAAREFFLQDRPQRPLSAEDDGDLSWAISRNGLFVLSGRYYYYYVLFHRSRPLEDMSEPELNSFDALFKEFTKDTLTKLKSSAL